MVQRKYQLFCEKTNSPPLNLSERQMCRFVVNFLKHSSIKDSCRLFAGCRLWESGRSLYSIMATDGVLAEGDQVVLRALKYGRRINRTETTLSVYYGHWRSLYHLSTLSKGEVWLDSTLPPRMVQVHQNAFKTDPFLYKTPNNFFLVPLLLT